MRSEVQQAGKRPGRETTFLEEGVIQEQSTMQLLKTKFLENIYNQTLSG